MVANKSVITKKVTLLLLIRQEGLVVEGCDQVRSHLVVDSKENKNKERPNSAI